MFETINLSNFQFDIALLLYFVGEFIPDGFVGHTMMTQWTVELHKPICAIIQAKRDVTIVQGVHCACGDGDGDGDGGDGDGGCDGDGDGDGYVM